MTSAARSSDGPPVFDDDPELFDQAFAKVKKTFQTGETKPYAFRMAQLTNLKKGIQALQADFDKALTQDLGKDTFVNWLYEINICLREVDDAIANLKSWMKDECVHTPFVLGPAKSYIQYEPLGVVCVIGSWNYPLATLLPPLASAMAAGNAVVVKPSEMAPYTAVVVKQLLGCYLDTNAV